MDSSSLLFSIICLIYLSPSLAVGFSEHCRSELQRAREVLVSYADEMVHEEHMRMRNRLDDSREKIRLIASQNTPLNLDDEPTHEPCPSPNSSMFTTTAAPSTTYASTTELFNTGSTDFSDFTDSPDTSDSTDFTDYTGNSEATESSSSSKPMTAAEDQSSPPRTKTKITEEDYSEDSVFSPKPLYTNSEADLVASYHESMHKYLSSPREVCNGPQLKDLNSITEHQLFGFLATVASVQPGPFCAFCHSLMTEVQERLFTPSFLLMSEEEQMLRKALYSQIPSPKAVCSMIAPGCYENYENKAINITAGLECAKCSGCMTVTNLLQHRLLLQPKVVESFLDFLKSSLFHNICAELCQDLGYPNNYTLFPHGFTYSGCVNWFADQYHGFIRFVTVVTRPERLCSLELGWCELNEVPNMLHCLRELCDEVFGHTPQTKFLCSQIPDEPEAADQFLNIQSSKVASKRKSIQEKLKKNSSH